MRRLTFLIVFYLVTGAITDIFAQTENIDTAVFKKIRTAEMSNSHVPWIAHYITDVSGSRLTNSPGFFRAAKWAVETMKSWGLVNANLEPWGDYGRGWEDEEFSISMKAPYQGYITGYPLPWSASTNGEVRAAVYSLLRTQLLDSAFMESHKNDFKGKIILMTNTRTKHDDDFKPFSTRLSDSALMKMPDDYMLTRTQLLGYLKPLAQINRGMTQVTSSGALAIVDAPGSNRDGTVVVQAFSGFKLGSPVFLPEAIITSEDGFKIKRLLASGHPVELALNIKAKFYGDDTK